MEGYGSDQNPDPMWGRTQLQSNRWVLGYLCFWTCDVEGGFLNHEQYLEDVVSLQLSAAEAAAALVYFYVDIKNFEDQNQIIVVLT